MPYTIKDLCSNINNVDIYIMIFEKLIYEQKLIIHECELSTSEVFHHYKFKFCKNIYGSCCEYNSILKVIIENNRIDIVRQLYQNNINIHNSTGNKCCCILNDVVIFYKNMELIDLMIDNGFNPSVNLCKKLFKSITTNENITTHNDIIIHFIERFGQDKNFILMMLSLAIRSINYPIIILILDNMEYYEITTIDFNNCVCDSFITFDDINKKLIECLCTYGFDLDANKDKIFAKLLQNNKNVSEIKFLLSQGLNFNDCMYDLKN